MGDFCESFQKELGKRLAQLVSGALTAILSTTAWCLPKDKPTVRLILLCLSGVSLLALAVSLFFRYFSIVKSEWYAEQCNKKAIEKIMKRNLRH
jgi:uncharacterized membrane protein HdeD (DUF308 family)